MPDFGSTMKNAWVKGMEVIGNAANSLASSTRLKVSEINIINQRKELLDAFGPRAYELWKNGAVLPEELAETLRQVASLDEALSAVRAERVAAAKAEEEAAKAPTLGEIPKEPDPQLTEPTPTDDAVPTLEIPVMDEPEDVLDQVSDAIDHAVESLSDYSQASSQRVDQLIQELNDKLK